MSWRVFFRVAALLGIGNLALALAVVGGFGAPGPSAWRTTATSASMATQRLAEVYANDAFRYVITHDYAALNVIIRQTANWPELVYVSVEDAQGRILAHSDPARVGQTWSAEMGRGIRTTVKVPYEEVVAVMTDPSGDARTKGPIGRVRLGFITDAAPETAASRPSSFLWVALASALVLAFPMAFVAIRLINRQPPPAEAEPEQVTRLLRDLKETATEAQRLRTEQTRHADEMTRLQRERAALSEEVRRLEQQIEGDLAADAMVLEQGRELAEALRTELDHRTAEAAALRTELDRQFQAVPAMPPPAGAAESELEGGEAARHAQYRAVGHIGQVFRHSLTTILGFSRLLLRSVDGSLNARQRTDVENIQRAGDELLSFINTMSELARADLGSLPCRRETAPLGGLLVQAAQTPDVATAVKLMIDPEDSGSVEADPRHMARALHLLLQYAVSDAQGGSVVVTTRSRAGVASVEIAYPRGPLAPDELHRLFDPFTLAGGPAGANDTGRVRLALARSLIRLNGGQLSVEAGDSAVTFSLTLPQDGGRPGKPTEPAEHTQETAPR